MKLAIISDTHAGCRNNNLLFLNRSLQFINDKFLTHLKKNNISTIIHLGDIFDKRKEINFHTHYEWRKKFFSILEKENIEFHAILGNHDLYFKDTNEINSVSELLDSYSNIKIYKYPTVKTFEDLKILFFPWIPDNSHDIFLKELEKTSAEICMGHLELNGFQLYPGKMSEIGLSKSLFSNFELVLSGHYHSRSVQDNIYYIGSPYQMNWNDADDVRGFHIFDTKTRELEFIKNEDEIFIKLMYNDKIKNVDEHLNDIKKLNLAEKYIKIIVESKINILDFEKYLSYINAQNPGDVSIIDIELFASTSEELADTNKSTLEFVNEFIDDSNLEFKKEVKDIMHQLYTEAVSLDVEE